MAARHQRLKADVIARQEQISRIGKLLYNSPEYQIAFVELMAEIDLNERKRRLLLVTGWTALIASAVIALFIPMTQPAVLGIGIALGAAGLALLFLSLR